MTYSSEVLADSPLLYWRLGEASGSVANDSSAGGTFDGTYNGGATLGSTGLLATDSDTSVSLDGVDDYVSYSGTVIASSSALSIEMWFKMATPASVSYLFQVRNGTITSDFRVAMEATGALTVVANPTGTGSATFATVATFGDNQPHHAALTYSDASDTATLYIDGVSVGSGAISGGSKLVEVTSVGAGAQANGNTRMGGVIDEFAVYGTALSGSRVLAHYTAGTSLPPTNVTPTFTAANTQTYAPEIVFGELDVTPGFTAANTQAFPPSVAAGAQRNITVTAAVERGRWHARVLDPDRTAEVQPPRHRAGVTP